MLRSGRMRAALVSAIAVAAGLAPWTAVADAGPSVSLTVPQSIDMDGAPGDLTVTVADPPATDAFVRLYFAAGTTGVTVTDAAGTVLPSTPVKGNAYATYIDVDSADSDGNGVPGAPLAAGDIPLHISAAYPGGGISVQPELIDGATGNALYTAGRPIPSIAVNQPNMRQATQEDADPFPLLQTVPADYLLDIKLPMLAPPATTLTTLTFSAAQLAAGGYTAAQVAANLTT